MPTWMSDMPAPMKWYFCLNEPGLLGFSEIILAAVHSALKHTSLRPHLIYDGPKNAITEYLSSIGVSVTYHRASFSELIDRARRQPGFTPEVARGAYLRLDIPLIESVDQFVLYTDCDVIFFRDPDIASIRPSVIAAAPEYAQTTTKPVPYSKVFNSGVMILNIKELELNRIALIDFACKNDFYFHGDGGFYDQGALNKFFVDRWTALDQSFNWRPFAAYSQDPKILHFHGVKPYELAYILRGDAVKCRPISRQLFDLQPVAYLNACEAYLTHLPPDAERLVSAVSPATPGFIQFGRNRTHDAINEMRKRIANCSAPIDKAS